MQRHITSIGNQPFRKRDIIIRYCTSNPEEPIINMANKKSSGAEITEAERNDPNAAWEATITKGMKETESEMFLQWISIIMIGAAVAGYWYL